MQSRNSPKPWYHEVLDVLAEGLARGGMVYMPFMEKGRPDILSYWERHLRQREGWAHVKLWAHRDRPRGGYWVFHDPGAAPLPIQR